MLALTRRARECIRIGDDVIVKVIGIQGDRAILGFSAPKEIEIVRTEIEDHRELVNAEVGEG